MLKILGSTECKTRPAKSGVGIGGSRARRGGSKLDRSKLHGGEVDGGKIDGSEIEDDEFGKKVQKKSKSKNWSKSSICLNLL